MSWDVFGLNLVLLLFFQSHFLINPSIFFPMILEFHFPCFLPLLVFSILENEGICPNDFPIKLPSICQFFLGKRKGYRLRDAWRLIQSKRPVPGELKGEGGEERGRWEWLGWERESFNEFFGLGIFCGFHSETTKHEGEDDGVCFFCRKLDDFFVAKKKSEGEKKKHQLVCKVGKMMNYFEWVYSSINCIWRNNHVTSDLVSMIFMVQKCFHLTIFGRFLHLHVITIKILPQSFCWGLLRQGCFFFIFSVWSWILLKKIGELTQQTLETLDLGWTMEETSPRRPLGLQVARPNVGYCRQLVDFEKTSTGWAAWLGAWIGVHGDCWKITRH